MDASLPPLYFEDLVIALRNAWLRYARLEGNTRIYEDPGCSIDPEPAVLRKLQALGGKKWKWSVFWAVLAGRTFIVFRQFAKDHKINHR